MVRSYENCTFWTFFEGFCWLVWVFFPYMIQILVAGSFQFDFTLTILPQQLCHVYTFLPTVELSSSTTSTFLSLYSTLKSSIRGCLSTICLDGTTWRNAEEDEEAEEAAVE